MGHAVESERLPLDGGAFRAFLETCPLAAFLKGLDGRYLWVNRAWERAFGHELASVVGKTDFELFPLAVAELSHAHEERVKVGGEALALEVELPARQGDPAAWQMQKFALIDAGVELIAGFATPHGPSPEAGQLARATKMQALGQLAGGIAHDFNNSLATIVAMGQFVLDQLPKGSPLADDVRQILDAGQRAAALTRELRRFALPSKDERIGIPPHALISSVGQILRRLIGESIELHVSLDPALRDVKASAGELEQILLNLAFNARDAMPQGGRLEVVANSIELDARAAEALGLNEGGYLRVEVSDQGTGMDEATRERIFEPFFTTKAHGGGTGLGLSTVLAVVQRRGGHIAVTSEPSRGTTFTLYLPDAAEPTSDARPVGGRHSGSETILVVEDDALVCTLARRILDSSGYTVLAADNGRTAVELARRHPGPIHLVLADVVMPKLGGELLVRTLRADRPELRALYMTGYAVTLDADVIEKPFTPDALCEKVREVLDRVGDSR